MDGAPSKPKFAPKLPPKKEKVEKVEVPNEAAVPSGSHENSSYGRGGREGGRGGRGRGRGPYVAPQGRVFFSGLTSSMNPTASYGGGGGVRSSSSGKSSEGITSGISIKQELRENRNLNSSTNMSSSSYIYNSDSEDEEELQLMQGDTDHEQWPPVIFDSTAPLSLPYGPKTVSEQTRLAQESLFAHPSDTARLTEETEQIFLMQLPSTLELIPRSSSTSSSKPAATAASKERSILTPGKIGKIQILKSGRIILKLDNGKVCEVNNGLPVSFLQYAVMMELGDKSCKLSSNGGGEDVAVKMEDGSENRAANSSTGDMYLLGGIAKKIVISDSFA